MENNRLFTGSERIFINNQLELWGNKDAVAKVGCKLVYCEEEFPQDSEEYKAFKRNSDYVDLALQLYDIGKSGGDISSPFKGTPLDGSTEWPSDSEVRLYGGQISYVVQANLLTLTGILLLIKPPVSAQARELEVLYKQGLVA